MFFSVHFCMCAQGLEEKKIKKKKNKKKEGEREKERKRERAKRKHRFAYSKLFDWLLAILKLLLP